MHSADTEYALEWHAAQPAQQSSALFFRIRLLSGQQGAGDHAAHLRTISACLSPASMASDKLPQMRFSTGAGLKCCKSNTCGTIQFTGGVVLPAVCVRRQESADSAARETHCGACQLTTHADSSRSGCDITIPIPIKLLLVILHQLRRS